MFGFKLNKSSAIFILTWFLLAIAIVLGTFAVTGLWNYLFLKLGQPLLGIAISTFVLFVVAPIAYLIWYLSKPSCVSGSTIIDFIYFLIGGPFYISARLKDAGCKK